MSLHSGRREPTLDPPEFEDMTDWCTQHGPDRLVPYAGFHRECLLCVGREEWQDHLLPDSLDDPQDFEEWLYEVFSGQEDRGVEYLREQWLWLLRCFRWDTATGGERLTIRVSVCAWCGGFLRVGELRERLAVKDSTYIVSHDICGDCTTKMESEAGGVG